MLHLGGRVGVTAFMVRILSPTKHSLLMFRSAYMKIRRAIMRDMDVKDYTFDARLDDVDKS